MPRGVKGSGKHSRVAKAAKPEERKEVGKGVKIESAPVSGDANTRLEVVLEEMQKLFASFRDGIEALCAATKALEEAGDKLAAGTTTKPARAPKEETAKAAKEEKAEPKEEGKAVAPKDEPKAEAKGSSNGYKEGDFVKTLWKSKEGKEFKAVFVRKDGDNAVLKWTPSKRAEVTNPYSDLRGKLDEKEIPKDWVSA